MEMMKQSGSAESSQTEIHRFGIGIAIALAFWGIIAWLRQWNPAWPSTFIAGAVVALFVARFAPIAIQPLYVALRAIGHLLGIAISCILLTVIYYCAITSIGFVRRFLGYDSMRNRFGAGEQSCWEPRSNDSHPGRYFRKF
jgi:hypothetical protein